MKTIFWNTDTQYDFMRDDEEHKGKLVVAGAKGIEGNLETLTKTAAKHPIQVINTADWHTKDSEEIDERPDYKTTFPEHCMAGTKGAQYVPATTPQNAYEIDWRDKTIDTDEAVKCRNIIIYKDAFDAFGGNRHTANILAAIDPQRVIVYGVATNVCVDYAVEGLRARGKEVYVVKDAIKELPNLPLEQTIERWTNGENPAKLIRTAQVEEYLR